MGVVQEICRAIQRNPNINRVIVCRREYDQIRDEFEELSFVRWERPKYGTTIEKVLWDEADAMRKRSTIQILGRPVECRAPGQPLPAGPQELQKQPDNNNREGNAACGDHR